MKRKRKQSAHPVNGTAELFFQTGYVIGLEKDRYFAGFQKGKIRVLPVERAKYFPELGMAEKYAHRYLEFAGMQIRICRVCWTLVAAETIEHHTQTLKDKKGRLLQFDTYQEAVTYQKKYADPKESMVDIHVFQEKVIIMAA